MTLTFNNIPAELDRALRDQANAEHKSLDQVAMDAMARGLGVQLTAPSEQVQPRDLSDIAGSGGIDDEIEAFLWEQRRIDPELWQ